MKRLKWLANNIEFVAGATFSGIMIILLFIQVVSRYLFGYSIAFTEEIATILFILSVYMGAVGATRRKQHLKIELVINMLKPKTKLIVSILANIVFMVANGFIIYGLIGVTLNLKKYGMTTAITQIPKWTVYAVIPIVFVVITIRLIEECVHSYREIKELNEN